jgi:3-hydroxyisobutyrate dehydrogenase-like beta-hydroxyacid dehydrogenase
VRSVTTIGVLHPGEMGSAVGAAARAAGAQVLWAPEGRSEATAARAQAAGLDAAALPELLELADVVLSICPPHAALDVAREVAGHGFGGTYVDANAISPATTRAVASVITGSGAAFVDAGIIGSPPLHADTTRLCLSGPGAADVGQLFAGSPLEAWIVGEEIGTASALKMCYAAWTKGSAALLLAVVEAAEGYGVADELAAEWERTQPGLAERAERVERQARRKAWRWVAEMEEIAATFEAAGAPPGFHQAAARVFERLHSEGAAPVS